MAQEDGSPSPDIPREDSSLLTTRRDSYLYRSISRSSEQEHLPPDDSDLELTKSTRSSSKSRPPVWSTLSILLVGVFVSQTDSSLVLATYGKIASEFNAFESGTWLMSSLLVAACVAQPLYGKLSDIYGRKVCLQAAYIFFAIGTAGTGLGKTFGQVVAFRAVQGAGAAGMTSMVSVIITDLVPIHQVASLRAYVNVLATTGRSCGGVIGGFLTQKLGWRWAFLIQVPPILIAIFLVQRRLHIPAKSQDTSLTRWEKLKRIDFVGSAFLCLTILAISLILDMGGQKVAWHSTFIEITAAVGVVSGVGFIITATLVPEPVLPLRLLAHYSVLTNCVLTLIQMINQMALMMNVPLYYQAVRKDSPGLAGAYLIPAFAGNTIGGLLAGYWIKWTGRFKIPTVLSPLFALLCAGLCYTIWGDRPIGWESLCIFPGGFATGMISSSAFVGMAAGVAETDMAIATSAMYLFFNLGSIGAVSAGDAVFGSSLKGYLRNALRGRSDGPEILRKAMSSLSFVQNAGEELRAEVLVPGYVHAFHQVNILGAILASVSLTIAVVSKGGRPRK